MNAGRILVRALVVIGGTAAACVIAWLTATASASTVTQVTDGPIGSGVPAVASAIGDPQPPVLSRVATSVPVVGRVGDAATPARARVRGLSGAAAHTARLADVLDASVTHAVASVPATVRVVGRIAVTATDLTGQVVPADGPRDHVGKPAAGPDAAGSNDALPASATSDLRKRSAGSASTGIRVRVAMVAIAGESHADRQSDHGAGGLAGRSWLPSCAVAASAGFTAAHDRGCGDAVQPPAAQHPQPPHRRHGVLRPSVTAAEIQPGVTPD